MAPHAILLDALGTLLAIDDPVARLLVQLRERHAIEVAPERAALALRAEMSHYRRALHPGLRRRAAARAAA